MHSRTTHLLVMLMAAICCGSVWAGSKVDVLWAFQGANRSPSSLVSYNGALYGIIPPVTDVSWDGSGLPNGAVFQLSPPREAGGDWTKTIIYTFPGGIDGYVPSPFLTFDNHGALYGSELGGPHDPACSNGGNGEVFQLTPPAAGTGAWTYNTVYPLCLVGEPGPHLLFHDGALYGTTSGASGSGAVVQWTPPVTPGGAWTAVTIYNFAPGGSDDGFGPFGNMVFDSSGNLYGTTAQGGNPPCAEGYGCGTVFQLAPPNSAGGSWTETILYRFAGDNDGSNPQGVAFGPDGALYGSTLAGGSATACSYNPGCGTIFRLAPPPETGGEWTESVLYAFAGGYGGDSPTAAVVDQNGAVYTTTQDGGDPLCNCGAVFQMLPPQTPAGTWEESMLYAFNVGADGWSPAGLICERNGKLDGVTIDSGGNGVVFRLSPPAQGTAWTETVLYGFGQGADGNAPQPDLAFDNDGALYGVTSTGGTGQCVSRFNWGCGTVFKLTPPATVGGAWSESVLYNFAGGTDGANPYGVALGQQGVLYGATGSSVFQLGPPSLDGAPWIKTVLYTSSAGNLGVPSGPVIVDEAGALYGTAVGQNNYGLIFQLKPPVAPTGAWTGAILHTFQGGAEGLTPGSLVFHDGVLYGVTLGGDASDHGAVIRLTPPPSTGGAWTTTVLHSFAGGNDGASPSGTLAFDPNDAIYGTTQSGGTGEGSACPRTGEGCGTIYRLSPPAVAGGAWNERILYSFGGGAGAHPDGLVINSGVLYGTVWVLPWALYQLRPPSSTGGEWSESVVERFAYKDGGAPTLLMFRQRTLYATAMSGGAGGDGTVFEFEF
ncbi:MAG TPA: choice-of-anchor tandem repeat GloVer-containing protein [Bryobacteraceae bacterium]|jgi:hypothetical protein|nr:choice-of-anchor tandem repeat GloVer-containing protein [Bryobacteraceae bacterium]